MRDRLHLLIEYTKRGGVLKTHKSNTCYHPDMEVHFPIRGNYDT